VSDYVRLTDDEVRIATEMWEAGKPEFEIAQAIGLCVTTLRRRRGDCLAGLQPRGHSERDCGRRSEPIEPRILWERCARVRLTWSESERAERSKGIAAPLRRPGSTAEAGPFPQGHGLRVIPIDRSRR